MPAACINAHIVTQIIQRNIAENVGRAKLRIERFRFRAANIQRQEDLNPELFGKANLSHRDVVHGARCWR